MPILDTRFESTNRDLLNLASLALTEAAEFSAKLLEGFEDLDIQDLKFEPKLDPPEELGGENNRRPQFRDFALDPLPTVEKEARERQGVNFAGEKFQQWLEQFFPALMSDFKTIPEDWIVAVMAGEEKALGIGQEQFRRVWQRSRDREEAQRQSDVQQAKAEFSQRGFAVPPGAMVSVIDRAQQRASAAVQEVNREETVREQQLRTEMLQFAVQQAATIRQGLSAQVVSFLQTWDSIQQTDKDHQLEKERQRAQIQTSFYENLRRFIDIETALYQVNVAEEKERQGTNQQNIDNFLRLKTEDPGRAALGQAIRGLSDIAGSSSSAAGSLIAQIEGV